MSTSTPTIIKSAGNYVPFIESDPRADNDQLRATLEEHGYLFFRDVASHESILQLRREILELCDEAGWLDKSYDLMEGIVAPGMKPLAEGQKPYMDVYRKIIRLENFINFASQPSLMALAAKIVGPQVLVHGRHIGRITFPSYEYGPTPPHQDFFYIRGTTQSYTCWIPLGECPLELGGLAVWAGSQHRGFMDHSAFDPKAVVGVGVPVDEKEAVWHTGDFGLGDALFFHSYTVHKALPNLTPNKLRLSTDNRYQSAQEEIDPASMQPHFPNRGDEEEN